MTEKELVELQDSLFEASKSGLTENLHIPSVGFLVMERGLEKALDNDHFGLDQVGSISNTENESVETGYSIVAVDMEPDDEAVLEHYIRVTPKILEFINQAMTIGAAHGVPIEVVYSNIVEAIFKRTGANRKDVAAHMVRQMCENSKAFAFIYIGEGYFIEMENSDDRKNYARDLANDDRSIEIVFSVMECLDFNRHIKSIVIREPAAPGEKRDSGKVLSIEGHENMIYRDKSDPRFSSRFSNLLVPVN